jgi:hypothetical protein
MTAKITTVIGDATITEGVWKSENKSLEEFLNKAKFYDVTGAKPSYDIFAAEEAVKMIPFSVLVDFDEIDYNEDEEGTVY